MMAAQPMALPMTNGVQPVMMVPVMGNGGVMMPQQVPMAFQQAPMAMMQSGMQNGSGWPQQQQQPPQNGNLQQPGQIVHIQGTTPVIPQQEPAQNAASKAAPGRLQ